MATKKAAKKNKAKKIKEKTDEQVFKEFSLGPDQATLRNLVSSQRKINGRLYKSIEAILDALPKGPTKGPFTVDFDALNKADKINEAVPGEGVGCTSPTRG
jgi:hypothetical protein